MAEEKRWPFWKVVYLGVMGALGMVVLLVVLLVVLYSLGVR